MALNKITFEDKVALNPQPEVAEVNKVTDANINQIKSVVNAGIDALNISTYTLTDTPAHSGGTNGIYIAKIGNLVVINLLIWCNDFTANSWLNIGTLPNEIVNTNATYGNCTIVSGSNGNQTGYGLVDLYDGKIRIKPNISVSNTLTGIRINLVYVI